MSKDNSEWLDKQSSAIDRSASWLINNIVSRAITECASKENEQSN